MKPWITTALVILAGGSATCDPLPEAIPNYMFSAILGSGYYQVEDASLAVVRIPFSLHLQETTLEQAGLRLLLPITIGYASLDPDDNIERWLPTKFGSLSFIPGIEYRKRLGDHTSSNLLRKLEVDITSTITLQVDSSLVEQELYLPFIPTISGKSNWEAPFNGQQNGNRQTTITATWAYSS